MPQEIEKYHDGENKAVGWWARLRCKHPAVHWEMGVGW
jgi:hypothetical protein